MAASTELSLVDVINTIDKLTYEQTKDLVVHFGVQLKVLVDIETEYRASSSRKSHAIQAWLNNDTDASWEKVVLGLDRIGMNVLAKAVATQYCPAISSTDPNTTTTTSPLQVAVPPLFVPDQPAVATSIGQPATDDRTQPVALCMRSVTNVRATIQLLERTFSGIITHARSSLCARESHNHEFLDVFRDHLLVLPVAKKAPHVKFFRESEDDILEAKSIRKLFAILSRYWSYRNYEILRKIVDSFCASLLQARMMEYCKMLEGFEKATTVDVYLTAIPDEELEIAFSRMVLKIDKPASECTLYDVRRKTKAAVKASSLHPHSVYIGALSHGCVEVVLRCPFSAVGWVLAAMTPDFMHTRHITEVAVDGKQLTAFTADRHELDGEIIQASKAGDVVRVVSLLNSGAEALSVTALDYASLEGHLQVVRLLLHRGAKVECRDKDGYTPLISAAWKGKSDVVIDLLDSGANVNAQSNYGVSALMLAARGGHTKTVVELVEAKAILDLQSKVGDTAVMIAAWLGHTETLVELVKGNANLDLQNKDGYSALLGAAEGGYTDTVAELVKAKANVNLQNIHGYSALMRAASGGYCRTVTELVKAKASLDLQNVRGDSAVIKATVEHESDVLRVLVEAGSDLNLQNEEGLTALMIAARSGRSDITDILLDGEHIDLDIQENCTGWSALFFSAERGDVATTQSLLTAGANVHLKDKNGLTALEVAIASEQYTDEVHKLLIQASATPHHHPHQDTEVDQDSVDHAQDITATQEDRSIVDQDTPSNDQDGTTISSGYRRRRRVPQALRKLVNVSGQRIQQIFNQLNRRLKSADKKAQSGVRGQETEEDKNDNTQTS